MPEKKGYLSQGTTLEGQMDRRGPGLNLHWKLKVSWHRKSVALEPLFCK